MTATEKKSTFTSGSIRSRSSGEIQNVGMEDPTLLITEGEVS